MCTAVITDAASKGREPDINLYRTNAPNPFKSASYQCNTSVRCGHLNTPYTHVEAYTYSPTFSPHYTMVCGQIHAPATLPNYLHMHLMNSKFVASL
jgi:hypothetical protein